MTLKPTVSKKRLNRRQSGASRSRALDTKTRRELSGSFQLQARRDKWVADKTLGRGAAICPSCKAVYFDKHWHASEAIGRRFDTAVLPERFCDECHAAANVIQGQPVNYAGEVVIRGLSDPAERLEVMNLVRQVGKRAVRRDPEERVAKIIEAAGEIRVYVTENQLAASIGKQIFRARKGGRLVINWSADDKVVRVVWTAKG